MSHLKSSIRTMTNKDMIDEKKDLTILHNIRHNCNNNYKICHNDLLYSKNYDLLMSAVRGESKVNPRNQDIKIITTNSDEYPYNYVLYSNKPRNEIILRTPCCKPLTVDKNFKKNGEYKNDCCGSYNQCIRESYLLRNDCECNNNQRVLQKLSTPVINMNSRLFLSNLC